MKIPFSYYIRFWFINTLLALGTGIILGIMSKILVLTLPILVVSVYQFFVFSYFWGRHRGAFEFSFLERVERRRNKQISILLNEAKQERKMGDPTASHNKLKEAINTCPSNYLAQFRYAISCENIGDAQGAIAAYKAALNYLPVQSEKLIRFIEGQIARVQTKGPSRRTSAPGLQYVIW